METSAADEAEVDRKNYAEYSKTMAWRNIIKRIDPEYHYEPWMPTLFGKVHGDNDDGTYDKDDDDKQLHQIESVKVTVV